MTTEPPYPRDQQEAERMAGMANTAFVAGMLKAAKIAEEPLIYGNREDPAWAQRIVAGEIRRRASEIVT